FGAFVDIGLKDSGLVHISQMANRYIKSPYDVVAVGDVVTVWVLTVDKERHRVSLTMIKPGTERRPPERKPAQGQPQQGGRPPRGRPRREPPKPKLSQAALEGKAPLRTFAELSALLAAKQTPPRPQPAPAAPAPTPAPEAVTEPAPVAPAAQDGTPAKTEGAE